jgi:hypothetical protein
MTMSAKKTAIRINHTMTSAQVSRVATTRGAVPFMTGLRETLVFLGAGFAARLVVFAVAIYAMVFIVTICTYFTNHFPDILKRNDAIRHLYTLQTQ